MPLLTLDVHRLYDDGCQLKPKEVLAGIMADTNNDPCTTGCAYFDDGKCPAYRRHFGIINPKSAPNAHATHHDKLIGGRWTGKSMKQIAAAEGISLNEARRRKERGDYSGR